jgi:hypothetical protein
MRGHRAARCLDQSQPGERTRHIGLGVADRDTALHPNVAGFARRIDVIPLGIVRAAARAEPDGPVLREIGELAQGRMAREVVRRRAVDDVEASDAARRQPRVLEFADAHDAVDALGDQIDEPCIAGHDHAQARIARQQFRQRRDDGDVGHALGKIEVDSSFGLERARREHVLRVVPLFDQAAAVFEELRPLGSETHAPRRAREQLHAERTFELQDRVAGGGAWNVQAIRSLGVAAGLGDRDEQAECLHLVHHVLLSKMGQLFQLMPVYPEKSAR